MDAFSLQHLVRFGFPLLASDELSDVGGREGDPDRRRGALSSQAVGLLVDGDPGVARAVDPCHPLGKPPPLGGRPVGFEASGAETASRWRR